MDNLTFEIIKRIISNIGVVPSSLGKGLSDKHLCLDKTISVKYDNGLVKEHDVYAGQLNLDGNELKGLLVDLSVDDIFEFMFVFRMGALPIHVIKIIYGYPDDSYIRVYHDSKDKWIIPNMFIKARLLSDFEQFVSWGLLWDKCEDISDLYNICISLVESN